MTERERLIDMLAHIGNMRIMRRGLEECADYMLANGVIVPPCKVGDSVYWPTVLNETIEAKVTNVSFAVELPGGTRYQVLLEDIGKCVFLTREEAEKELVKWNEA